MSIHRWTDKQIVIYTSYGILLRNEEEWNIYTWNNMGEWKTKKKKKEHVLCDSIYIKF